MDYTDLMVGDWVRFRNDYPQKELQGKIANVRGINGRVDVRTLGGEYLDSEHPNWLEPIRITQEILEKSGFEKQGDLYQYHINAGNGYTRIDIIDLQDGLWSYDIDVYDKFADAHKIHNDDDCFLKLHQLQHLLRLCGIKKEIEL